jgi:hypothetical protein
MKGFVKGRGRRCLVGSFDEGSGTVERLLNVELLV